MKKINELTGFRDPNACEKEFIGQYFEKVFQHQMKTCMGLSIIFCVIGIFCVSACSVAWILCTCNRDYSIYIGVWNTSDKEKISEQYSSV